MNILRRSFLSLPGFLAAAPLFAADSYLRNDADRAAFLRWFTFLAEAQFFTPPAQRAAEVIDCSSLLRYAYREALRRHDSAWAARCNLPLVPAIPSVAQYNYPRTPTGPRLFYTGRGAYAEFADAGTLCRYNSRLIDRELAAAQPGDLLFYRHAANRAAFHSMIVLGRSQFAPSSERYVVYDTGPDGESGGEIKRLSFEELLHFPEPRWQPIVRNPSFLGVYRWAIIDGNPIS